MKKLVSLLLVTVMLLSCLLAVSCSNKKELYRTAVGNVGNYEVYYEELRWLTMQYKDLYESAYGKGIWDSAETAEYYRKSLEEDVYSSIIANYAVLTMCDDEKLTLNGEKLIDINSRTVQGLVDDFVLGTVEDSGGRSNYLKELEKNYLTESLYRFITGVDLCENLLFKQYCELLLIDDSDAAAHEYITQNFIRTKHIYIQNDAKDNVEENRALAEAVRNKLLNGDDLDTLIANYSEDGYMSTENGYYFTRGQYSETYENASFALGIGNVSDVIETFSGFYVIVRLPLDTQYIMANLHSGLKDQYLLAVFDTYLNEFKKGLTFTPNEFGSGIDLTKMK